jgi:hypothetical protein
MGFLEGEDALWASARGHGSDECHIWEVTSVTRRGRWRVRR